MTVNPISVCGLDSETWKAFRTMLRRRGTSVSSWAVDHILADLKADKADNENLDKTPTTL